MDTLDLKPLKLIAKDVEDLQIMAAHLQDAILPMISMEYDPKAKMFRALANRFCWEHGEMEHEGQPLYHRTHTGIEIHNVTHVSHKGLDFKGQNRSYNLISVHSDSNGSIHFVLSGGSELRLDVENIHLHLGDVQHPWPTRKKPKHIHEHVTEIVSS